MHVYSNVSTRSSAALMLPLLLYLLCLKGVASGGKFNPFLLQYMMQQRQQQFQQQQFQQRPLQAGFRNGPAYPMTKEQTTTSTSSETTTTTTTEAPTTKPEKTKTTAKPTTNKIPDGAPLMGANYQPYNQDFGGVGRQQTNIFADYNGAYEDSYRANLGFQTYGNFETSNDYDFYGGLLSNQRTSRGPQVLSRPEERGPSSTPKWDGFRLLPTRMPLVDSQLEGTPPPGPDWVDVPVNQQPPYFPPQQQAAGGGGMAPGAGTMGGGSGMHPGMAPHPQMPLHGK